MDELPQNQLNTRLKNLQIEFRALKNKQIIGNESIRPQRYFSEYTYDLTVTSASFNIQQFRLSFVPDNTVQFQGLVYRLMYTVTPSGAFFYEVSFVREVPVGSTQYWLFTVLSDPGDIHFKFYFAGSSRGILNAVSV